MIYLILGVYWIVSAGIIIYSNRNSIFYRMAALNVLIVLVGGFFMPMFAAASLIRFIDRRIHKGEAISQTLREDQSFIVAGQMFIGVVIAMSILTLERVGFQEQEAQMSREIAYQSACQCNK